jgi:hypothetical protein
MPRFWQRTLLSHPTFSDNLTPDDIAILEHMINVSWRCA